MLAFQLKQLESKRSIPAIRDSKGIIINDQKLINHAFKDFYSNLYQAECTVQDHSLDHFLKNVPLPVLNVTQKDELETPIIPNEIESAIKSLSSGKISGGDGFTIKFYKRFSGCVVSIVG